MTTKIRDIVYGSVQLDDSEFEPKAVKVRITTMIDEDVLVALKEIADDGDQKYQTLLNRVLRAFVENHKLEKKVPSLNERRVRQIVREELERHA